MKEITCAAHGCGVTFYVTDTYSDRRRDDCRNFFCPNGHSMAYSKPTPPPPPKKVRKR